MLSDTVFQLKRQNEELKLLDYDSNERIRKEKEREYSNIDSVKNEKNGRYGNNLRTMYGFKAFKVIQNALCKHSCAFIFSLFPSV